jgi:hypothetical protein
MKKSGNIILIVSSLAVVGVLGYLLMKQLKETQNVKSSVKSPKDAEYTKFLDKQKESQRIANRTLEEMRADFEKYGM